MTVSNIDNSVCSGLDCDPSAYKLWQLLISKYEANRVTDRFSIVCSILNKKPTDRSKIKEYLDEIKKDSTLLNTSKKILPDEILVMIVLNSISGLKFNYPGILLSSGRDLLFEELYSNLIAEVSTKSTIPERIIHSNYTVNNNKSKFCNHCKKQGHLVKDCFKKKKAEKLLNSGANITHSLSNCAGKDRVWIMDSGGDDHFCCQEELFSDLEDLEHPIYSKCSNQSLSKIEKCGYVMINNGKVNFRIKCKYAPEFENNYLSPSMFFKNGAITNFVHKDQSWFIEIDGETLTTRRVGGLDYVNCTNVVPKNRLVRSNMNKTDADLIHERFGHVGEKKLQHLTKMTNFSKCSICLENKMKRKPYNPVPNNFKLLERVVSDVAGPFPDGLNGEKYFLTMIDVFSRFCRVSTINSRTQVVGQIKEFVKWCETQTGARVKSIFSDNAKEFVSNELRTFCKKNGIELIHSSPYCPQQNGIAERKNQSLLNVTRCLLNGKQLPQELWPLAVHQANRILNRLPSATTGEIPFKLFFGKDPDISKYKVFGSLCYLLTNNQHSKLNPRGVPGVYVGTNDKGYDVYHPKQKSIAYNCRNARIIESESFDFGRYGISINQINPEKFMFSTDDYDTPTDCDNLTNCDTSTDHDYCRDRSNVYSCNSKSLLVPSSYQDALKSSEKEKWCEAMNTEYQSLLDHDVFEVVDSSNRKLVTSKWHYDIKLKPDNSVERFKARLVARGFSQKYGVDYTETYAPVVDRQTVRLLLSLASKWGWNVSHLDIQTAFLNGVLEEEVFLDPPAPYKEPDKCWRLKKSLYGLKQSPLAWNNVLSSKLISFGLTQSLVEPCVFYSSKMYVIIYVDDILAISESKGYVERLIKFISSNTSDSPSFKVKDLGDVRRFLGVNVNREERVISLNQSHYIKQLSSRFDITGRSKVLKPLPSGALSSDDNVPTDCPVRELIGALNYISQWTRPDIAAAVSIISRDLHNPTKQTWKSATHVLKYLNSTIDYQLRLSTNDDDIQVYADADFGQSPDRYSQTGYLVKVFGSTISWCSQKQKCVAKSTSDAELIAMVEAMKNARGIHNLLTEIGVSIKLPITVFEDNRNCVLYSKQSCPKHIEIDRAFLKEMVSNQIMLVEYIPTRDQLADPLTKSTTKLDHQIITTGYGLVSADVRTKEVC